MTVPLPNKSLMIVPFLSVSSRSLTVVLVVAADPHRLRALLVAAPRRAVEQAVVGHRGLEAARARHVRPVDDAIRARVHAHTRSLGYVTACIGPAHARVLLDGDWDIPFQERFQL